MLIASYEWDDKRQTWRFLPLSCVLAFLFSETLGPLFSLTSGELGNEDWCDSTYVCWEIIPKVTYAFPSQQQFICSTCPALVMDAGFPETQSQPRLSDWRCWETMTCPSGPARGKWANSLVTLLRTVCPGHAKEYLSANQSLLYYEIDGTVVCVTVPCWAGFCSFVLC